tara:strand:- start:850 stop:1191 length:342 start_codon:yes stop_codon:yes gene_type:complete
MLRKIISVIFLLFIIIICLLFSEFSFETATKEGMTDMDNNEEDTLLNPTQVGNNALAPAPSPMTSSDEYINNNYGMPKVTMKEGFTTKSSYPNTAVYTHLMKDEKPDFNLKKF